MYTEINLANKVVVLGHGTELSEAGVAHLTVPGQERVERAAEYYHEHRGIFDSNEASIVCAGGYAALAGGMEEVPLVRREARLMANYLITKADVPASLIQIEDESTSTLLNLVNVIQLGYINPHELSPENPLGIVTHPYHMKRAIMLAGKLGIKDVQSIPTEQQDDAVREFILRNTYRALLAGATKQQTLVRREQLIGRGLSLARNLSLSTN